MRDLIATNYERTYWRSGEHTITVTIAGRDTDAFVHGAHKPEVSREELLLVALRREAHLHGMHEPSSNHTCPWCGKALERDSFTGTIRFAKVQSTGERAQVERYLPANYELIAWDDEDFYLAGIDRQGWTLHEYVLPRLASGLHYGQEMTDE